MDEQLNANIYAGTLFVIFGVMFINLKKKRGSRKLTKLNKHLAIICQNKQLPFIFEEAERLGIEVTFFIIRGKIPGKSSVSGQVCGDPAV
ncbi:hypothetical protein QKW52_09700 [Bacillus sonorensis]|nr:hypothetical protein [Bacillus sonorensis]